MNIIREVNYIFIFLISNEKILLKQNKPKCTGGVLRKHYNQDLKLQCSNTSKKVNKITQHNCIIYLLFNCIIQIHKFHLIQSPCNLPTQIPHSLFLIDKVGFEPITSLPDNSPLSSSQNKCRQKSSPQLTYDSEIAFRECFILIDGYRPPFLRYGRMRPCFLFLSSLFFFNYLFWG